MFEGGEMVAAGDWKPMGFGIIRIPPGCEYIPGPLPDAITGEFTVEKDGVSKTTLRVNIFTSHRDGQESLASLVENTFCVANDVIESIAKNSIILTVKTIPKAIPAVGQVPAFVQLDIVIVSLPRLRPLPTDGPIREIKFRCNSKEEADEIRAGMAKRREVRGRLHKN